MRLNQIGPTYDQTFIKSEYIYIWVYLQNI